jgi:hypothetical protein
MKLSMTISKCAIHDPCVKRDPTEGNKSGSRHANRVPATLLHHAKQEMQIREMKQVFQAPL